MVPPMPEGRDPLPRMLYLGLLPPSLPPSLPRAISGGGGGGVPLKGSDRRRPRCPCDITREVEEAEEGAARRHASSSSRR